MGSSAGRAIAEGGSSGGSGAPCPSCHAMQREWERNRRLGAFEESAAPNLLRPERTNLSPEESEAIKRWLEAMEPDEGR